jgi:hypothetical protein
MNTKDENLLVKVVKKAVGLPTGDSCACGTAPKPNANDCCNAEATESASSGCGCSGTASQEEKPAAQA